MLKFYVKTTETCQLRCRHCYIGDFRDKQGFFDEAKTAEWILKESGGRPCKVSFHGGEPFLCPLEKMQYVCDHLPQATFDATTNLMYGEDRMRDIIRFAKKNFKSEDGKPFMKTSYDYKIRFGEGQEELFWKNVGMVQDAGIRLQVTICLTSLLVNEMPPEKLLETLLAHDVMAINFERLTENTTADKSLLPEFDDVDRWLLRFYKASNITGIDVEFFRNMEWAAQGVFLDCRARGCMKTVRTINADGSVGGCPNTSNQQSFANIDGSYDEQKHELLKKQECTWHMECFMCGLFKVCNGDCHQISWKNGKCPEPKRLLRRIMDDASRK